MFYALLRIPIFFSAEENYLEVSVSGIGDGKVGKSVGNERFAFHLNLPLHWVFNVGSCHILQFISSVGTCTCCHYLE